MTKTCQAPGCKRRFETVNPLHIYCSDKCREKVQKIKRQERDKKRGRRLCQVCEKKFYPKYEGQKYCSEECEKETIITKEELDIYYAHAPF